MPTPRHAPPTGPQVRLALFVLCGLLCPPANAEGPGSRQRILRPHEYGNVLINNSSRKSSIAPVVFSHWVHRSRYTCRVCHVDIGFAMEAGGTGIQQKDIDRGAFCGACHDGKIAFGSKSGEGESCGRCHNHGNEVPSEDAFADFSAGLPRARSGNRIDWVKAEREKRLHLVDEVPGVSIPTDAMPRTADVKIDANIPSMPDILFSHEAHAVWNGCEVCHPQIFPVKRSEKTYSMQDIFDGGYCGTCHGKVAFPTSDCRACHTRDVS